MNEENPQTVSSCWECTCGLPSSNRPLNIAIVRNNFSSNIVRSLPDTDERGSRGGGAYDPWDPHMFATWELLIFFLYLVGCRVSGSTWTWTKINVYTIIGKQTFFPPLNFLIVFFRGRRTKMSCSYLTQPLFPLSRKFYFWWLFLAYWKFLHPFFSLSWSQWTLFDKFFNVFFNLSIWSSYVLVCFINASLKRGIISLFCIQFLSWDLARQLC